MSNYIVLIDKRLNKLNFVDVLEKKFHVVFHGLDHEDSPVTDTPLLVIVNIHLENKENVRKLEMVLEKYPDQPKLFLVNDLYHPSSALAGSLGADRILRRPPVHVINFKDSKEFHDLEDCVKDYLRRSSTKIWSDLSPQDRAPLEKIDAINNEILDAIIQGEKLPKEQISESCDKLVESMRNATIGPWLNAVKTHHSYTLRHCITVTGLAIAFGMHFNWSQHDLKKLATGALMHDIGKVKIPLSILDKPAMLNMEEIELIRTHPVHSAEILRQDGQFDDYVIDLALHHHELLDGTGYPDGLTESEISDSVKMLTIIDIFSALVDQRSYKKSMTGEKAYDMMCKMEGMLDQELLRAFKPIALNIHGEAA